jgi:FkbM family methyltransferase
MLRKIRSHLPVPLNSILIKLRNILVDQYAIKSYSQEGEDMILSRIFEGKRQGFYVDVGAHHPRRFSNTFLFYKRGWSGINVEPNPDAIRIFNSERPRDINLHCGVAESESALKYYYFSDSALNTFDKDVVKSRLENTPYKLVKTEEIAVTRLDHILKMHLPPETEIDFLSIDVEGFDLSVLKSNDWNLYRPTCVLAEVLNSTLEQAVNSEIAQFMRSNGYSVFARTYNTLIFRANILTREGTWGSP